MMKLLILSLTLLRVVASYPTSKGSNSSDLFIPPGYEFKITSLNGPGCPDLNADPSKGFVTRPTSDEISVENGYYVIGYKNFAYPHLSAEIRAEQGYAPANSWCETTVQYREFKDNTTKEEGSQYALSMNVNGTKMAAAYELEEGVEATWDFFYASSSADLVVCLFSFFNLTYSNFCKFDSTRFANLHASIRSKTPSQYLGPCTLMGAQHCLALQIES
jgi:hypothetical protein